MASGLDIDLRGDIEPGDRQPPRHDGFFRWWIDVLRSWGPPILLVLVIRSILIEPFQIPSGSMVPTLAIGDFILVSKMSYGLRLPFTDIEVVPLGEPERGDIVVFIFPVHGEGPNERSDDPFCWVQRLPRAFTFDLFPGIPGRGPCSTDFIKRIIGLPGDTVEVRDHVLFINDKEMPQTPAGDLAYQDPRHRSYGDPSQRCETINNKQFMEDLDGEQHPVLQSSDYVLQMTDFRPKRVPEGQYFMMGDNRDNSEDSRFWGFVPRTYIRGKAQFVWLSFDPCRGSIRGLGALRSERIGTGLR